MAKSISHERKITIYPDNQLRDLVIAECAINNTSRSDIVSAALKQRYENMPGEQLRKIQAKAEKLAAYPKR